MNYLMLRNFDQGGYYETRLILMIISLAIAAYFIYYKKDRRFLLIFASGVLFQTLMEYWLRTVQGAAPAISLFGATIPAVFGPLIEGVFEGGVVGLFAFWFADLRSARAKRKEWWPFYIFCGVVGALSLVVGIAARGHFVTSARPIFAAPTIFVITVIIFISLMIAWRKDDLSALANFFAGLLLFAILNFEPMHALGVRYIGILNGNPFVAASLPLQIVIMFLSHVFEAAGGKLHYFMLPFAFGLIELRERQDRNRERYSTQHLQDLASRGWRKRSKPFTQ